MLLQSGFQRGRALATAGIATLATNAIPIAAAMTLFREPLPGGILGFVRVAAFASVVISAVWLAPRRPRMPADAPSASLCDAREKSQPGRRPTRRQPEAAT
jgi:hypothetical protein